MSEIVAIFIGAACGAFIGSLASALVLSIFARNRHKRIYSPKLDFTMEYEWDPGSFDFYETIMGYGEEQNG